MNEKTTFQYRDKKFRADRSVFYLVAGSVFLIAALIVTVWLITLMTPT